MSSDPGMYCGRIRVWKVSGEWVITLGDGAAGAGRFEERSVEPATGRTLGSFCPRYQRAVEIVGRRWSGAILRAMLAGATRFGEIQEAIPDLSNRMLSERLRELEDEGIVERVVLPERPVRIEYSLTGKGRSLNEVVEALSRWAEEWLPAPENGRQSIRESE